MQDVSPNRMTLTALTGRESVVVTADMGSLPEVLEVMERFLRASGFHFDGELDIINELDPELGLIRAGGTD
jgi:hypothetical protein